MSALSIAALAFGLGTTAGFLPISLGANSDITIVESYPECGQRS